MLQFRNSIVQFSQEMLAKAVKTIDPADFKHQVGDIGFDYDNARYVFFLDHEYTTGKVINGQVYCNEQGQLVGFIKILDLLAETEWMFAYVGKQLKAIHNSRWGNA